jgi:hypothetical protein
VLEGDGECPIEKILAPPPPRTNDPLRTIIGLQNTALSAGNTNPAGLGRPTDRRLLTQRGPLAGWRDAAGACSVTPQ